MAKSHWDERGNRAKDVCVREQAGAPRPPAEPTCIPDGLSDTALGRLSDEFVLVDLNAAPTSTDVLLTHPISTHLLGTLRERFPRARVIVTEIEDEELDVHYLGPVSRLLDAGAAAHLSPRPIAEVATTVHAHLSQGGQPALQPHRQAPTQLPQSRSRTSTGD